MNDYPTLRHFFGAYLHEDWPDEFADEWAAADGFVREEPQAAPNFKAEMDQLLLSYPEEHQLRHMLLYDFGAAAMMENLGWKYRDWLQAMADHVEKAAGHPQAS
ncbi:MAG: contact-dependent growth inhibition system immunity protein [Jatrophihabitantaceae bacterium]